MSLAFLLEAPVLCVITDETRSDEAILESVEQACAEAHPLVQLRVRNRSGARLFALAQTLREVTSRHGAALLVNDRLDVALAVGADGVHLPAHGLPPAAVRRIAQSEFAVPGFLVGLSVHSVEETARYAPTVDYLHFGPVFATPEKERYGAPLGVAELERAAGAAGTTPVIAVGGVDASRVDAVIAAGASGVAVIRAVLGAHDVRDAARRLGASLRRAAPRP